MTETITDWTPRERPSRKAIAGRYVDLAPLTSNAHAQQLFEASSDENTEAKFTWLAESAPTDLEEFCAWMKRACSSQDPLFYAVIDKATGRVAGRHALMRVEPSHGSIEIGHIYWGPLIARQRGATEALFLMAKYVFDDLGYRRFEWKCDNDNLPSKAAATRFGFQHEGTFRQHMVVKGLNRDTAWFSMIDKQWPALRTAYEAWLAPSNFDDEGRQKTRLEQFRSQKN